MRKKTMKLLKNQFNKIIYFLELALLESDCESKYCILLNT